MLRLVALVLVVAVAVLAYQATRTGLALRQAAVDATTLRAELGERDLAAAERTSRSLAARAHVARKHSDGFLWAAATALPVVGDDADAVRRVAAALDELSARALPGSLDAARALQRDPLRGDDGAFDLAALRALRAPVTQVSRSVRRADARLEDVDVADLAGPIRPRVAEVKDQVARLDTAMLAAATATEVLPAMLGGDGERRYLLVVQNNAEVRGTGGLPGSVSVLRVRDGRLTLGRQGSAADAGPPGSPPAGSLTPDEGRLFGQQMVTDFRDANTTPDFPRAASLMAEMASRTLGPPVDGVVSLDPVVLSALLEGTGPVQAPGGRLDADNVVRKVLFEPYQELPPEGGVQDAYFAATSAAVFDALTGGTLDESTVLAGLAAGAQDRRVLVWSRRPAEQDRLQRAGLAGAVPRDTGDRPAVGFYLNSGTQAKIQYFLRYGGRVRSLGCTEDGRQVVQARFAMRSEVPTPVSQLAPYVSGLGDEAEPGVNLVNLAMYAPTGGTLTALRVGGEAAQVATGTIDDRDVAVVPVELAPGERTEVVADFTTRRGQDGDPVMQWTPGLAAGATQAVATSRCG
ncbi:hypothetical protein ASG49_08535 [Marmoricola sp. Leaf446]|uniref:DUF4012 domain-containing protein n=1 Tax=Marmoricola sp. Leaf446 TaxID=1736379 RepID=UPI0006F9B578|nr:DUF4012 domain-containing protein [Marmoricola sp. Leaf446]KQT92022.1 hypothetical protein ASG49_08535 [Marmoricola sp. Leaf446]